MNTSEQLEIALGLESQLLFKTPEEQRDFEKRYSEQVQKALDKLPRTMWFRPYF